MRRLSLPVAIVASLALASTVLAGSTTLRTFGNGDVTVTGDSATIVNELGEYGGVYIQSKSQGAKPLSQVVFQFRSTGDSAGGAPRFSIPIDTDGKGKTDNGYAFLDVNGCGGSTGVETLVTTQSGSCAVNFAGVDYANWTAFAAANPTYRTAPGFIPFIIADAAGSYAVDSIVLK
jgi:predicted small secreted protein